jgi:hypothetical protein
VTLKFYRLLGKAVTEPYTSKANEDYIMHKHINKTKHKPSKFIAHFRAHGHARTGFEYQIIR